MRVPPPGSGSAHMTPPCSTMIWRARCRPTPAPDLLLPQRRLARGERLVERLVRDAPVEALSTVGHGHDDAFVQRACDQLDRMSGGGVAAGVVEELSDDPADAGTIRDRVEGVRYLRRDRDGRVRPGYLVDRVADEGTEIHVGDLERERAPFEFGDRDDLVDDLHQACPAKTAAAR